VLLELPSENHINCAIVKKIKKKRKKKKLFSIFSFLYKKRSRLKKNTKTKKVSLSLKKFIPERLNSRKRFTVSRKLVFSSFIDILNKCIIGQR